MVRVFAVSLACRLAVERTSWLTSFVAVGREAIQADIEALALGALGEAAMFDSEALGGINETLEITLPQPTYSPQASSPQDPVSPRQ